MSASKPHSEQLETRWMLLKAHIDEHGTGLQVLYELLDRVIELEEQKEAMEDALTDALAALESATDTHGWTPKRHKAEEKARAVLNPASEPESP